VVTVPIPTTENLQLAAVRSALWNGQRPLTNAQKHHTVSMFPLMRSRINGVDTFNPIRWSEQDTSKVGTTLPLPDESSRRWR
jgi:hypothetical protein